MIPQKMGPVNLPEPPQDPAFEDAKKQRGGDRSDLPDFGTLLSESSKLRKEEQELEAQSVGQGGELKIGENKTDKEFREMLEKVTGKKQDKLKNKLEKDDYLNLMVTQLKYQDPTKPMDNQEMATQLAQFNTVEQLMGVNKTLTDMRTQQNGSQADKLSPYLGKNVEVAGSQLKVRSDRSVSGAAFDIPAPAGTAMVVIKDSAGQTVRSLDLGNLQPGRHKIEWDGKDGKGVNVSSGQYTFSVEASGIDGKPLAPKTSYNAKVDGIVDLASGGKLDTSSGPVELKDIMAIRADDVAPVATAATAAVAAPSAAVAGAPAAAAAPTAPVAPTALATAPNPTAPAAAKPATPKKDDNGIGAALAAAAASMKPPSASTPASTGIPDVKASAADKPAAPKRKPVAEKTATEKAAPNGPEKLDNSAQKSAV